MSYIRHFSQKLIRHPIFSGSFVNKLQDTFNISGRRKCKYHILSMRRNSSTGVVYLTNLKKKIYDLPKDRKSYDISYIDDKYIYIRWNNGSIDKYSINSPLPETDKYPEK